MCDDHKQPRSEFLNGVKSIAVAGVSLNKKFGSIAFRELKQRGYDVYPIHPSLDEFDGERCYHSPGELPIAPDCLLVSVAPDKVAGLITQAAASGIKRVWFQQAGDFAAVAQNAREAGLEVMTGRCILMYAEPVQGFHRFHRAIVKLFGNF